ncbi:MAG: DNA recombination protein RmuC [Acidobacteriia bacterium]|jgi:DNA recombination protein RmuC|nr:DNA recombination protein RmuC [Terriglobia bacterium]
MESGLAILVAGVLVVVVALLIFGLVRQRIAQENAALRQEMQNLLNTQAQITTQVTQLMGTINEQLSGVQRALQEGVQHSGQLVAQAQNSMREELKSSRETLAQIQKQLGEVQQAGRRLSEASETLERVLGAAQRRGSLGEIALERLLADALPQASYEIQYRFSTGDVVDAAVKFRGKLLAIDSKFPLESYQRLATEGEAARRGFAQAVRTHADSIAKKYILRDEGTLDVAFMFVPSESVYYELLMSETQGVTLDEYCRRKGVIPVSPNTLYAYLSVILMGLQGMQIEENARQLASKLAGLVRQFDQFAEIYEKLGKHLHNAQQNYEDGDRRLTRARSALEQLAQGTLAEGSGAAPALEPAREE